MGGQKTDFRPLATDGEISAAWGTEPQWRIARRLGLSRRQLRWRAERLGLVAQRRAWSAEDDDLVRNQAGRWSWARIGREVGRSAAACEARAKVLRVAVLRDELPAAQCAELVGRKEHTVAAWIRRGELRGRQDEGGTWRVWPSVLRAFIIANPDRIRWLALGQSEAWVRSLLVSLLAGEWGVPDKRSSGHRDA